MTVTVISVSFIHSFVYFFRPIYWCVLQGTLQDILASNWRETSDSHRQDTAWLPPHPDGKCQLKNETRNMSPYDFFSRFFPEELYQVIADHTNTYAQHWIESRQPLSEHSRMKLWRATNADEIKAFISIEIAMGLTVTADRADHLVSTLAGRWSICQDNVIQ